MTCAIRTLIKLAAIIAWLIFLRVIESGSDESRSFEILNKAV